MSRDWVSKGLTIVFVLLMVTSTIPSVSAAGTGTTTDTTAQPPTTQDYNFEGATTGADTTSAPEATTSASNLNNADATTTQPRPEYANPELESLSATIGAPIPGTNQNGSITIPIHIDGEYKLGQYPWRIPVSLTIESGDISQSAVVYVSPGIGEGDYTARTTTTLQFVQDSATDRTIRVSADSQVDDTSDVTQRTFTINGVSEESSVSTDGQIRNDDVSEPPSEVSQVSRYKASERASGYLEDTSLPVGETSKVSNFTNARDANNEYATLNSFRGGLDVGTLTSNVPNGDAQTLVIRYRSLNEKDISVTPVDSTGAAIDRTYTLPADTSTDKRCHTGADTDLCVFRLTDDEADTIGNHNELILKYHTNTETSLALFCQDVVTGGMPDDGSVCGLGEVNSYKEGRIVQFRAVDTASGNQAGNGQTLEVDSGAEIRIDTVIKNQGNTPLAGTVRVTSNDPTNFTSQTRDVTLSAGETRPVSFSGYTMDAGVVQFTTTFEESTRTVEVAPTGLADSADPVSVPGGPYIVPLNITGESKELRGLQQQTLSERPGVDWTRIESAGSSGGTDNWTTNVNRVPVIGTISGLENADDNLTYIQNTLDSAHGGSVSIEQAYSDALINARSQLPPGTEESEWRLHDIQFTTHEDTTRKIDTDRPEGFGWRKITKYGTVATGDFETEQFRSLANGSEMNQGGTIIDTAGAGWVKQDDVPPEKKLTGYVYNNSTVDPDIHESDDATDGENDWEKYQYIGTKKVTNDRVEWNYTYKEERYDPGGEWKFEGEMDNGTYRYSRATYSEEEVWMYRKPVYHWYYTYERPVMETSYEWERHKYDAKVIFQRSASSDSLSLWEGPDYEYERDYENKDITLNGSRSYDIGPDGKTGISAYQWEFDNGETSVRSSDSVEATRDYTVPFGVYKPSLTVWDNYGNSDTEQTEVHVIPCESNLDCMGHSAIPELTAEAKRDPVDWQMEDVSYTVDISGNLYEREWAVNITAPAANASFSQEIWRGYDIVDGHETIHEPHINPRTNELGPGPVTFEVVASPAGKENPKVVDTFSVYLCDEGRSGFHPSSAGCDELDADNDGLNNGIDTDPYCSRANNAEDDTRCYCARNPGVDKCQVEGLIATAEDEVSERAVWNSQADWNANLERNHLTFVGAASRDETQGTLRLGYAKGEAIQEIKYPGLVAFYPIEKMDLQTGLVEWSLRDYSYGEKHKAYIFADGDPNSNGGEFKNRDDADVSLDGDVGDSYDASAEPSKLVDRAPELGEPGVFGSLGTHYEVGTAGHIEFISPSETDPGGEPRAGDSMQDEFWDDMSVSFWAKNTNGREQSGQYSEMFWSMQNENSNNWDSEVQNMRIRWGGCENNFFGGDTCTKDAVHGLQRWYAMTDSGSATYHYNTFSDNQTSVPSDDDGVKNYIVGDSYESIDAVYDRNWHHYTYVVDGGSDYVDSNTMALYVDGEPRYIRSFESLDASSADPSHFTVSGVAPGKRANRFIWGGTWRDLKGLTNVMEGMRFDNIRLHGEALTQSEVSQGEYIDNGIVQTTPKYLNETTKEEVDAGSLSVRLNGYLSSNSEVKVTVIPWEDTGSGWERNLDAADTTSFQNFGGGTTVARDSPANLGVDNVSRVSIRANATSASPADSPRIDSISVQGVRKVNYEIDNEAPIPVLLDNASNDSELEYGDVIRFTGSYSQDNDGDITEYSYSVDGPNSQDTTESGSVSSGDGIPNYNHEFKCAGEHTVTLSVRDEYGAVNDTSTTFTVDGAPPNADATPSQVNVNAGDTVNFDAYGSSDSDGEIINYDWHFEHVDQHTYNPTTSWTYSSPGTYYVNLTVTDDGCLQDSERVEVNVENSAPNADAGPDQTADTGESVSFDGTGSSDPDGDALTYEWDFDSDGAYEATGATPSHSFSSSGNHPVTLRVTDPYGGVDTDVMTVTAETPYLYQSSFNYDDGWSYWGNGNYNAGISGGDLEIGVYQCSNVYTQKELGSHSGTVTVDFSYASEITGSYGESLSWELIDDGQVVYTGGISRKSGSSGTYIGSTTQSVSVDGNVKIRFQIEESWACSYGDHGWTRLDVRHLTVD